MNYCYEYEYVYYVHNSAYVVAMIQSGNKEIITPATGINPSKKIITANTSSCGNPKTINAMTVRIQFTTAIKN